MAIITDDLRRASAQMMVDDINNSTTVYYAGIGKSDPWLDNDDSDEDAAAFDGIPSPTASPLYEREVLENLSSLSKVLANNAYRVIPRYNLGEKRYKVYDPNDPSCFEQTGTEYPCYVMNSNQHLFICLKNSNNAMSANEVAALTPSDTADGWAAFDSDSSDGIVENIGIINPDGTNGSGYVWAYLGKIDTSSGFYTSTYMAIDATTSDFTADTNTDSDTPFEATGGLLYGFKIENGGSGYLDSSVKLIVTARLADGSSIVLDSSNSDDGIDVVASGGVITQVNYSTDAIIGRNNTQRVQDIVHISCRIEDDNTDSGSGAIITPLVAPIDGFGGNNLDLLPSHYVGIKVEFPNTLGDTDGFVGSVASPYKFRQVSLLRGPITLQSEADGTQYADCLRYLTLAGAVSVAYGDIIWQNLSGNSNTATQALENGDPVAVVDEYSAANGYKIWYHQNNADGVVDPHYNAREFEAGADPVFIGESNGTSATISSVTYPEYRPYIPDTSEVAGDGAYKQNGRVMFVDNKAAIERAADQTEQIRFVIQF